MYAFTFAAPTVSVGLIHRNVSSSWDCSGRDIFYGAQFHGRSRSFDLRPHRKAPCLRSAAYPSSRTRPPSKRSRSRTAHGLDRNRGGIRCAHLVTLGTTWFAFSLVTLLLKGPPAAIAIAAVKTTGSVGRIPRPLLDGDGPSSDGAPSEWDSDR